jgi:hypothetical protein
LSHLIVNITDAMQRRNVAGKRRTILPGGMPKRNRRNKRADFSGTVLRNRFNPPRVLFTPWYQLVVAYEPAPPSAADNLCIDLTTIVDSLSRQLGISPSVAQSFVFRFSSVRVWHLSPVGESNNVVRVRFYSLIETGTTCTLNQVMQQVEDFGSIVQNANVGFEWPLTHQAVVLGIAGQGTRNIIRITREPMQQVLIHFNLLFRFPGSANFGDSSDPRQLFNAPDISPEFEVLSLNR